MESPPPLSCCLSKKSKKRMFSGTSSTCMEGADVVEIPPPVNVSSNSKQRKDDKEVLCPEIIEVDDDETWPKLKADTSDKGKQPSADAEIHHYPTGNNVKSSESSYVNESNNLHETYNEIIDIDDEYMGFSSNQPCDDRYARLQSRFDELDIPPGIEVPVPWFMDDEVNYLGSTSTTNSDSEILLNHVGSPSWKVPSPSSSWLEGDHAKEKSTSGSSSYSHFEFDMLPHFGTLQSSSSNDSSKYPTKAEAPKAFGDGATSDSKKKPPSPHGKYLSGSAKLSTKMEVPKALGYWEASNLKRKHLTRLHKFRSGSNNKYSSTVESNVHKDVTPNDIGSFHGLSLVSMDTIMDTNVDLSQKVQGHYHGQWDSSISAHHFSGSSDSPGPPFFTFDDKTDYTAMFSMLSGDPDSGNSLIPSAPSSCERAYEDPEVSLKKYDLFKRFDTVEDHSDHLFSNHDAVNQSSKGWAKKIQDEWRILEKDLPETIFVRVYESRMDLLRAVIIGAEGTPYHDGLFFFDMFFPQSYPDMPPRVKYHSGGLRINPNLYNCGKVCLSLLNTWSGSKKEMWTPGESTVLQILVSIQGLILNAKPYFNEPGYANLGGTPRGEIASLQYNERTLIYSLKTMVYSIRKPPKHFEDFVAGHFLKRADDILVACKAYLNGAQVGCLVKGGVQDVEAGDKSCSDAFKKDLATCLKTLVDVFAQVGVKDCEKFLAELESLPALQVRRQGCSFLH